MNLYWFQKRQRCLRLQGKHPEREHSLPTEKRFQEIEPTEEVDHTVFTP